MTYDYHQHFQDIHFFNKKTLAFQGLFEKFCSQVFARAEHDFIDPEKKMENMKIEYSIEKKMDVIIGGKREV